MHSNRLTEKQLGINRKPALPECETLANSVQLMDKWNVEMLKTGRLVLLTKLLL
jgi:hypothetical protein